MWSSKVTLSVTCLSFNVMNFCLLIKNSVFYHMFKEQIITCMTFIRMFLCNLKVHYNQTILAISKIRRKNSRYRVNSKSLSGFPHTICWILRPENVWNKILFLQHIKYFSRCEYMRLVTFWRFRKRKMNWSENLWVVKACL